MTTTTHTRNAAAVQTRRFDSAMYRAALAYYGLPPDYKRTFRSRHKVNRSTGELLYKSNGDPDTTLESCSIPSASAQGETTWVQVNKPYEDAALINNRYPKKAKNVDIAFLANVTLDFEYPPEPTRAHLVGLALADHLISIGLAEPGLPVEDSGAGCHIVLPLPTIELTRETAEQWNNAVATVVEQYIKPEYTHLAHQAGIDEKLEGFDISRILSVPGTWRKTNPKKADCEALKQGYLRRWLAPYVDGNYPVRKESARLATLITEAYQASSKQSRTSSSQRPAPQPPRPYRDESPSQWLSDYALQHVSDDRSASFQSLVNGLWLKYGDEGIVWNLKEDINTLSGNKYNGRLDSELQRSLDIAVMLPREERTKGYQSPANTQYPPSPPRSDAPQSPSPDSFNFTDLGNAERFAARYKDRVRWCETWNSWLVFNGRYWEQDKKGLVDQLAKATVRAIYKEAASELDDARRKQIVKHAMSSESNRAIRAMLERAKSELPSIPGDYNTHIYLLNCKNGTLDLRTGELHPHNPQDMLTRCIDVHYNPLATCKKWEIFINDIQQKNQAMITFLQEALGMSLTGDVSEQALFICHGQGSNGKTTMLEVVRSILHSYGHAANIETFQMKKYDGIGNDIAELYGARFVNASENKMGSRLNEALIKKVTGKEPLRARRLHENEFQFMPEFTLWLSVNHKPVIKDDSKGMWRRVRFIPFNVTFDEKDLNPHLTEELLQEAEGILSWLVRGCLTWTQKGRLTIPDEVKAATESYRAEMDIITNFIAEECTTVSQDVKVGNKQLLEAFEHWCSDNGEHYDPKLLKKALHDRGYRSERSTGGRYVWHGIGLVYHEEVNISEGSEGSEVKNKVTTREENTRQKTLNFSSLPSLPSLDNEQTDTAEMTVIEPVKPDKAANTSHISSLDDTEARSLYEQFRKYAQGKPTLHWHIDGSPYKDGPISPKQFAEQLRACLTSSNITLREAAKDYIRKVCG